MTLRHSIAGLACATLLAACVVAPAPGGYEPGGDAMDMAVTDMAPPAPYAETISADPFDDGVWIGGYWGWDGGAHHWQAGHWEHARPGYAWRPHAWEQRGGQWHLRRGGWDRR
jgi:hypothetical protein